MLVRAEERVKQEHCAAPVLGREKVLWWGLLVTYSQYACVPWICGHGQPEDFLHLGGL